MLILKVTMFNLLCRYFGRKLDESAYHYLQQCPLILEIKDLGIYVVHAGLLPHIPPDQQKPFDLMNMVSITIALLNREMLTYP